MKPAILLFGIFSLAAPIWAAGTASSQIPDRHFKIIQTVQPKYPIKMETEGISQGAVSMVLHVDSHGQLADSLVVAYTNRAFADEAERVVKQWKFESEYIDGEPVDTVTDVILNFEVRGGLVIQHTGLFNPFFANIGEGYQVCSMKNLDAIPTPISVVAPSYPIEWAEKGVVGKVTVDFYIDETGKVRFVAATSRGNPLLTDIAVEAVKKWQFAPPTRKGRPVLVHAQQLFNFHDDVAKKTN
jgi:TonB family protein